MKIFIKKKQKKMNFTSLNGEVKPAETVFYAPL